MSFVSYLCILYILEPSNVHILVIIMAFISIILGGHFIPDHVYFTGIFS